MGMSTQTGIGTGTATDANGAPARYGDEWREDGEAGFQRDRAPRLRTLISARMRGDGLPEQDVIVRNISTGGLCLSMRLCTPERGERLSIALPGAVDVEGEVRWVEGQMCGLQLIRTLDVEREAAHDWEIEEYLRPDMHEPREARYCS